MKTIASLLLAALVAVSATGCEKKEDPRNRPGFVDTTDPGKVGGMMAPLPKAKGGSAGAGAGPAPSQSKP